MGIFTVLYFLGGFAVLAAVAHYCRLDDAGKTTFLAHIAAAIVAIILMVIFAVPLYGIAEDKIVLHREDFIGFDLAEVDGALCWRVDFRYQGMILSWYEDLEGFDPTPEYTVVINGIKVIDAEKGGEPGWVDLRPSF